MIVCRVSVALLASTALAFWQVCAGAQEIAAPFSPPSIPLPSLRLGSEGTVYAPFGKGSIPIRHAADEYSVLDFGAKCDGLTNDTAAIQAAMNAAAVVKVSLTIAPRNATCRANDLYYKTGARLGIDGTLKSFGNSTTPLSNYSSAFGGPIESDVVIEGDGVIDNQMTARGVAHPVACIYSHGPVQDFTLRGVTLKGCGNSPVNIVGGSNTPGAGAAHVYLSYVKILGTGNNNANQFAEGCDDCWVDHIRIDNLTNDFLWAFYGNVTNSGITNSYINGHGNPGTMGIGVLSDAGQPAPSSNILIEGNEITGVDGCAVWVQGTSTATSGQSLKQKNIRIIGNDGHGNNTGRHPNWGGECILDGSTIASASNIWHDDGVANANGSTNKTPTAGIYFYPATSTSQAVDHYTSMGDTIFNEGVNGTGIGVVIAGPVHNGAAASNYSFIGIRIFDNQGTRTMVQAFNGQCNSSCTIIGSQIDPAIPSPFAGLAISGGTSTSPPATIFGNGPYANYVAGDVVIPGNSTNGGIGIFNGGLRATLPTSCAGRGSGTFYRTSSAAVGVCP